MIQNIAFHCFIPLVAVYLCLRWLKLSPKPTFEGKTFFINLAAMNMALSAGYFTIGTIGVEAGKSFADLYIIVGYFLFAHMLLFARSLSSKPIILKERAYYYIAPVILTFFHLNGWMVLDYRVEQNALMHEDGPLAHLTELYVLVCFFAGFYLIRTNIKDTNNPHELKAKNYIAGLSIIPLVFIFGFFLLLSLTPWAITIVVVGPVVSCYTAYIAYKLSDDYVVDLSKGLDNYRKRWEICKAVLFKGNHSKDRDDVLIKLKKQHYIEVLQDHGWPKSELREIIDSCAEELGVTTSAVRKNIILWDLEKQILETIESKNPDDVIKENN